MDDSTLPDPDPTPDPNPGPDPSSNGPGNQLLGERRPWPFGIAQTVTILVLVACSAVALGLTLGQERAASFNDVDAGFLADMSVHHNSAVTMGFAYLGRGTDPTIAHYARDIVATQSGEMTAMAMLLDEAGTPLITRDDIAMEWMGHAVAPTRMPGMPSREDMEALAAATGVDADELFTRLMITHHDAGAAMAAHAARHGQNPTVARLARTMARVQRWEIAEMNRRRAQLGYAPVERDQHGDQHGDHGAGHAGPMPTKGTGHQH